MALRARPCRTRRPNARVHLPGMQVGQGVYDKFNAARHNAALMGAMGMGHPGLAQLVAKVR